ncbi:MAG: alpha/beta fold hydrolase [Gammaproteobacteria bacterium]|nr:alpha/beta fold hydrolase [Gammaproteobacteria bacterium]
MSLKMREFTFEATDGYVLSACHFQAQKPIGMIIVASAAGVPQAFYRRFAEYGALQNFDVVTFDYRGIGKSAPACLKGFAADFCDWAQKDLAALVATLSQQSLPLYYVGHSFGGHALGLINNHHHLRAACLFGLGAGWHGWMPMLEQCRVQLLWHLVAPVLTRYQGYLGWSALAMGEDLPLGVYQQWKRWCRFPNYFFDDKQYPEMKQRFAKVTTPIKAVNAVDDKWASPSSRDAFIQHYQGAPLIIQDIKARDLGISEVGHLGYFRMKSSGLWPDILTYFSEHG